MFAPPLIPIPISQSLYLPLQVAQCLQQLALELSPVPTGFMAVEDIDGSLNYYGSNALCKRLLQNHMQLIAIRHGQALSNAQSEVLGQPLLYGQSESPLTDKGREQAQQCSVKLYRELGGQEWLNKSLEQPETLPVFVSSDVSRAQETAAILKTGLIELAETAAGERAKRILQDQLLTLSDERLRETHFGSFETRPLAELQSAYPDFVSHWRPKQGQGTDFRHRFPQGESRADVMRRVADLLNECCARFPGKTIIFISHGETLLSTRALLGISPVTAGKVTAETGAIPNAAPLWLVRKHVD